MRNLLLVSSSVLVLAVSGLAHAASNTADEYRTVTGLGTSAPDAVALANLHSGFTSENPAGVMYTSNVRANLQITHNADVNDTGVEAGYTGSAVGGAVGFYSPGCASCKSNFTGILGGAIGKDFYLGGRYQSGDLAATYGLGAMVNAQGTHRFGLTFNYYKPQATSTLSYTGGYAYVTKQTTFSAELSGQKVDQDETASKLMVVAFGLQKRVDFLAVSVNYQRTLNAAATTDGFWVGGGFNGETWHVGAYSNLQGPFMLIASAFL